METNTRNYHAHGGKLTFLPDATVEGAEGLFGLPTCAQVQLPNLPTSNATTVAALREDFNRQIATMKAAGLVERNDPEAD